MAARGKTKARRYSCSQVMKIIRAQARVDMAHAVLVRLDRHDPRFAGALDDYGAALAARAVAEKETA